jgi:hypothetical protein
MEDSISKRSPELIQAGPKCQRKTEVRSPNSILKEFFLQRKPTFSRLVVIREKFNLHSMAVGEKNTKTRSRDGRTLVQMTILDSNVTEPTVQRIKRP